MKARALIALSLLTGLVSPLTAHTASMRTFVSRSGWTLSYPRDWRASSCHSCQDVHAKGVFVDFTSQRSKAGDGWLMVQCLRGKPKSMEVDKWFTEIASTANLNTQIAREQVNVHGRTAMRVLYRTSAGGEIEETFVLGRDCTFVLSVNDNGTKPVAALHNRAVLQAMISSFVVR